jgi:hypothetical protein
MRQTVALLGTCRHDQGTRSGPHSWGRLWCAKSMLATTARHAQQGQYAHATQQPSCQTQHHTRGALWRCCEVTGCHQQRCHQQAGMPHYIIPYICVCMHLSHALVCRGPCMQIPNSRQWAWWQLAWLRASMDAEGASRSLTELFTAPALSPLTPLSSPRRLAGRLRVAWSQLLCPCWLQLLQVLPHSSTLCGPATQRDNLAFSEILPLAPPAPGTRGPRGSALPQAPARGSIACQMQWQRQWQWTSSHTFARVAFDGCGLWTRL